MKTKILFSFAIWALLLILAGCKKETEVDPQKEFIEAVSSLSFYPPAPDFFMQKINEMGLSQGEFSLVKINPNIPFAFMKNGKIYTGILEKEVYCINKEGKLYTEDGTGVVNFQGVTESVFYVEQTKTKLSGKEAQSLAEHYLLDLIYKAADNKNSEGKPWKEVWQLQVSPANNIFDFTCKEPDAVFTLQAVYDLCIKEKNGTLHLYLPNGTHKKVKN